LAVRASARQQKKRDSYAIHTTYKSAFAKQPEISRPGNTFVAANVAQTRTKDSTNPYPVIGLHVNKIVIPILIHPGYKPLLV